jgi:hypothetical protein
MKCSVLSCARKAEHPFSLCSACLDRLLAAWGPR